MVILLTSGESLSGGAGTYAVDLKSAFCNVKIASSRLSHDEFYIPGFTKIPTLSSIFAIRKLIKDKHIKTIICQSSGSLLLSILLRFMFPRLRIISIYHGLASGYEGLYLRLLEVASAMVSSKIVVMNLSDGKKIFNKKKQIYIPNYTAKDGLGGAANISGPMVSVTRWSKQKNNKLLEDFFKISDVDFCLYTKKSDHDSFKTIFVSDKQQCLFTSSKHDIYNNKSVFILSTYSEGFPLSILEAAGAGLPLVVSKIDLLYELLGENAQYFATAAELKEITDQIRSDKKHFDEWSKRSLMLSKEYSWDRWYANWANVLGSETSEKLGSSRYY